MQRLFAVLAAAIFLVAAPVAAEAQGFPNRPVRLIVPFGAGGATDLIARIIAEGASNDLGQRVVVENRQGAAGNLGSEAVARSAPDGYTWLLATVSIVAVNPFLFPNLTYDVQRDLRPVLLATSIDNMVAASPVLPVANIQELIVRAREKPETLTFASAGSGSTSHMQGELFQMLTGVQLLHVPYRGAPQAMTDLAGGRVDLVFDSVPTLLSHVTSGRLKALGMANERSPLLPGVATVAEQGVEGYNTRSWTAIMVPAGTPEDLVAAIGAGLNRVLSTPEVRERLARQGVTALGGSAADYLTLAEADRARWSEVIRRANIKVE